MVVVSETVVVVVDVVEVDRGGSREPVVLDAEGLPMRPLWSRPPNTVSPGGMSAIG